MPPFQLTPAQLALQAERKALKEAKKAAVKAQAGNGAVGVEGPGSEQDDKSRFLRREWVRCGSDSASASASESGSGSRRTTRIVTWNVCPLLPMSSVVLSCRVASVGRWWAFVLMGRSSLRRSSVRLKPGLLQVSYLVIDRGRT